jgi:hypothetical protein
MNAIAV